jgi:thiol-disulfide isomerase/thioredoxin
MRPLWRRLLVWSFALLLFASAGSIGLFKLVEHRLRSQLQPLRLKQPTQTPSDIVYTTLDGQTQHLSALKGKVVFLNLWGTWCIQCVAEMPTVQKLYDQYRNNPEIAFVVASRLDSASSVRTYAQRHHYQLPFYLINDDQIPESMRLNQYPATFIFARNGTLVAQHVGGADWATPTVTELLNRLMHESSATGQ